MAVLTFDNFELFEEVTEEEPEIEYVAVPEGITNGDFANDAIPLNDAASSWISWTKNWEPLVEANFAFVDGKMRVETLGVGDEVWHIQLGYRALPTDFKVMPGRHYKIEFDVHASVAGTFSFELTTTDNVANVPFATELVVGDNHVVIEFVAYEERLMFTACVGKYGVAVLTFDNFELYDHILVNDYSVTE